MSNSPSPRPQHDEVEQYQNAEATQEPRDSGLNVLVSIPRSIEVKMVDATNLSDYEIWFFGSGALLSVLTGFLVAYIQEDVPAVSKVLGIATLVFLALFVMCLIMTFVKRYAVRRKGRTFRVKTSNIIEEREPNQQVHRTP
ncbi:MAG: hypothetical protein KKG47_17415 [Proteobacteria bacterium]|nr:hypothetical protein [Pseudomonadota bacterium]